MRRAGAVALLALAAGCGGAGAAPTTAAQVATPAQIATIPRFTHVLVVVFVFTSLGLYFRLREADRRVRTLARTLAIESAIREGEPGGRERTSGQPQDGDELVVREPASSGAGEGEGVGPFDREA